MNEFLNQIIYMIHMLGDNHKIYTTITWIPSHVGIYFNEKVDAIATPKELNLSDIEKTTSEQEMKRVKTKINELRYVQNEEHLLLYRRFHKQNELLSLPRYQMVVLRQLRSKGNSMMLDSFKNRIGYNKSPQCKNCNRETGDLEHLIKNCGKIEGNRRRFFEGVPEISDLWRKPVLIAKMIWHKE